MSKPIPKNLPRRGVDETDDKYLEKMFKHLYGKQKRVKPIKPKKEA